jgi:hypothetical protein
MRSASPPSADTHGRGASRCSKTSVFQHRTGRRLEIRRVRFQAHQLRLVRRAERKQDEAETDGYSGECRFKGRQEEEMSVADEFLQTYTYVSFDNWLAILAIPVGIVVSWYFYRRALPLVEMSYTIEATHLLAQFISGNKR